MEPINAETWAAPHNHFVFWRIGQGLFYTGSLLDGTYNFVYDCGAEGFCEQFLNRAIDEFTSATPVIDFVVISHLHYDHCSGLYTLLQKSKVKKIYLPLLNKDKQFTLCILHYYKSLAQANDVDTRAYDLLEFLYNGRDSDFLQRDIFLHEIETVFVSNSSGFDFRQHWEFDLLAPGINSKTKKFFRDNAVAIENMIKTEPGKKFIADFKKLNGYTPSIERALNNTSTVLIHKPLYRVRNPENGTASILTGDIDFTRILARKIKKATDDSGIYVFQIPHHGSKDNWVKQWNDGTVCASNTYVISFGYGNKHRHPHYPVINWIAQYSKKYSFVTQLEDYQYEIH